MIITKDHDKGLMISHATSKRRVQIGREPPSLNIQKFYKQGSTKGEKSYDEVFQGVKGDQNKG